MSTMAHEYRGPERRRHRVYVTSNSEYHCRDGVCVAVRDLATGAFITDHTAIGQHIDCTLRFTDDGGIASVHAANDPHLGEQICFSTGDIDDARNVLTTEITDIDRPPKDVVSEYPR